MERAFEHQAVERLSDALEALMITLRKTPGAVQSPEFRNVCDAALRLALVSQLAMDEAQ